MTVRIEEWEKPLLSMASRGARQEADGRRDVPAGEAALQVAYDHCIALTRQHSRSFYLASAFLPREKQRGVRALYAFCRTADDIVDHPGADPRQALADWRRQSLTWDPPRDSPVALAWAHTRGRFEIPRRYVEQFLLGVSRDLTQTRYETFEDLATYCYGVAATVGLMSMHITGYESEGAVPYAVKLGVALQLTNILRDVGEDWARGRMYLPLEELEAFGLHEDDLAAGRVTDRWRAFLAFQIDRTRRLYAEAWPGIALLAPEGRFSIAAAADLYGGILDDIERNDYDVFQRRAHLSRWEKLARLPALWWRTRSPG